MSRRKAFDRFMVDVDAGRNLKLLRLTVPERWAYLHGVVALAAKSPDRGALLITTGVPATAQDVAVQASVTSKVAASAMRKARELGMLYIEDGVERVHDFEELNPAPRNDETNAERQARYRERRRNERNAVTPVTSRADNADEVEVEVEGEVEEQQEGPDGPSVEPERLDAAADRLKAGVVERVFDHWRVTTNRPGAQLLPERRRTLTARLKHFTEDQLKRAVDGSQTDAAVDHKTGHRYDDFKNIFRNGENVESNIARASESPADRGSDEFFSRLRGKAA